MNGVAYGDACDGEWGDFNHSPATRDDEES